MTFTPIFCYYMSHMALEQRIHLCATGDGVNLAYATIGSGPPLVKAANWLSHLAYDWRSPIWRHWLEGLASSHQLIRYDERGCGLSDWDVDDFSFEAWVQDLEAVVEAAGLERFPLLGISQGGAIAIAYAVRHPERVSHLILYGAYARGKGMRDVDAEQLEEQRMLIDLIRMGWGRETPAFRQVFTTLFMPEATPEQFSWFNELQRISSSPENAARIVEGFAPIDVTDMAPRVQAPTLILHATGDKRIPFEEGRLMASLIPGARFVPLESNNHILMKEDAAWDQFLYEVRRFLGDKTGPEQSFQMVPENIDEQVEVTRVVNHFASAGILFADVVGFTPMTAAIDPGKMVRILDAIFSHFDAIVEKYDLEKIRTMGDGYVVASGVPRPRTGHLFALADAALEMRAFAQDLPQQVDENITMRFGLNTGAVMAGFIGRSKLQYDVWGDSVNVASRMESQGIPGEIQITAAAYEALAPRYLCRPRGEIAVKGKGKMPTWLLTGPNK
ncbi:MAG: alpha/beta fold hydrolase [Candidatus Promineifilaceae bacterium]